MVALNPDFAPSKTSTDTKNRVGRFFSLAAERVGSDQSPSRTATKEKPVAVTILVSGRPFWLSRDPIAENGGINLYGYVGNDPINFWDPLELDVCETKRPAKLWYNLGGVANHYSLFIETNDVDEHGNQVNYVVDTQPTGIRIIPTNWTLDEYLKFTGEELNERVEADLDTGSDVVEKFREYKKDFDYSWPNNDCGEGIDNAKEFMEE